MKANNKQAESEARSVYERMIDVFFFFKPLEDLKEIVHQDFMGYGTAAHEFFRNRKDVAKMAELQSDQLQSQNAEINRKLISERVFAEGTSCLIIEEFDMYFKDINHRLVARLSTLLERTDGAWIVTHFHGSTPDSNIAEEEAFPMEGLRKKNLELEAKIRERTRDLEIEAALERARTQSMRMQHSSELHKTSEVFYEELQLLGIECEFSYLWLPDEEKSEHLFWATWQESNKKDSFRNKHVTFPLDKSEPSIAECYTAWESDEVVHVNPVAPDEVKDYFNTWPDLLNGIKKFRPELFPDGLYYVDAYMKYGCFGIMIRTPLSDEQKQILHRFSKEFERTYTRFLDLQKAEKQARETEIELALERIRARTMAMQHSDELSEASHLLDHQVRELGIKTWGCAFNIYREKDAIEWFGNEKGVLPTYTVPREGIFKKYYDLGQQGASIHVQEIAGKECIAHYEYMSTLPVIGDVLQELKKTNGSFPEYQIDHVVYFKYGYLLFITVEQVPEAHDIFKRFAKVFEQTYTRFLDLQKAEAQTREAEIELALERIRAQAMAMKESSELLDIVVTMRNEFTRLGHEAQYFWHMTWLPDKFEKAMTSGDGSRIGMVMELPRDFHSPYKGMDEWEKSSAPIMVLPLEVEEAVDYIEKMITQGDFQKVDPNAPTLDDIRHIGGITFVMARTTHGEIGYSLPGVVTDPPHEDLHILERFASAFDIAHRRFLDLKKSEAQAREVEVELALEKVRSRSMGMQKSDELKEVIQVVYDQFIELNIHVEHTGFLVDYKQQEDMHIWLADQHKVPAEITIPYFDSPHWNSFKKAKEKGLNFFTNQLDFKEKNKFYKALFEFVPDISEEVQNYYFGCHGLAISTVLMDNVGLYIENFKGIPYTDEENEVLMRFGRVFQQTYTRFLDLQKAEAQARESQIELGLERVRARAMAMQSSDELSELVDTVFNELTKLDLALSWCMINIIDEPSMSNMVWGANPEIGKAPESYHMLFEDYRFHHEMFRAWKEKQSKWVFVLKGKEKETYDDYLFNQTEFRRVPKSVQEQMRSTKQYIASFTFSNFGGLQTVGEEPLSKDSLDILARFGKEFDLTYTRFNDLQNAEERAREAQIEAALEKVRSRTMAMQRSDELGDVATVLFKELNLLVDNLWTCGFVLCEEGRAEDEWWLSDENGFIPAVYLPNVGDVTHANIYNAWKNGADYHTEQLEGEALQEHYDWLMNIPVAKQIFDDMRASGIEIPTWQKLHCAFFKTGYLVIITQVPCPEEEIFKRFAQVFDLTYTRFLDLQLKETQARKLAEDKMQLEKTLSDLQATQAQLIQSEKMASLGELTAGIAHEIQNPLNFVNNFSEVSKELLEEMLEEMQKGDTEEVKALAEDIIQNLIKIHHHGQRADGIVKGMLQHSRSGSGEKEPTDINGLCDEYLRLAYHGLRAKDKSFNATMETDFDTSIGKIAVVSQDIGRVILNLITNAFYAVQERKKEGAKGYEPTVSVLTKKTGNIVEIRVKDNGNGIPEAIKEKIFQPFFTTKPTGQGTGLGLSMSYDIVTKGHGGELKVDTIEGQGTTFLIAIPFETKNN